MTRHFLLIFRLTAVFLLPVIKPVLANAPFFRVCGDSIGTFQFKSIFPTADKGLVMCGTYTDTNENKTAILVKSDSIGTISWTRQYRSNRSLEGIAVKASPAGGYFLLADAMGLGADSSTNDFLIIKTELQGQLLWTKILGGDKSELPGFLEILPDGNLLVGGSSLTPSDTIYAYCAKLSGNGDLLWQAAYASGINQHFSCVLPLPGGNLVMGGSVLFNNSSDFFTVRLNATGDTLQCRRYGLTGRDEQLYSMIPGANGQITLAGKRNINTQLADAILLRVNANGDTIEVKTTGSVISSRGINAEGLFDGSILLSASVYTDTSLAGNIERALVSKLSNGQATISKLINPYDGFCGISQIKALPNGGFVCCGQLPDPVQSGNLNGFFARSNPLNDIGCSEEPYASSLAFTYAGTLRKGCTLLHPSYQLQEVSLLTNPLPVKVDVLCGKPDPQAINKVKDSQNLQLFPNPAQQQLYIKGIKEKSIHLFDAIGNPIKEIHSLQNDCVLIDVSHLSPGVYFIRTGEKIARFVKQP